MAVRNQTVRVHIHGMRLSGLGTRNDDGVLIGIPTTVYLNVKLKLVPFFAWALFGRKISIQHTDVDFGIRLLIISFLRSSGFDGRKQMEPT